MSELYNDKLVETRNRLIHEIKLLNNDEFNKRYGSNRWSVAQVCHHLVLTEKIFAKVIELGLKRNDSNKTERKNINHIKDRTKKIVAPEIVKPNSETMELQQVIHLLNDSRNEFLDVLSTVKDESKLAGKSAKHPIFGDLPLDQWIELLYLHEQRHIEQIKEVIENTR
ncbi:DinB family protein [Bacillus sp. 1NLA3E]|uniref:DinB family protein n=1 Tax=Bacillus sp. 1NLA3E TaxID=666686 RepID=UPI000247EE8C|nr:DinB family protein [Bacillus sp. 1NLA3E]AGK54110.1 hypothetical protein B1NLA3E_11800 [Bacillus sp. 1NLA3E]